MWKGGVSVCRFGGLEVCLFWGMTSVVCITEVKLTGSYCNRL